MGKIYLDIVGKKHSMYDELVRYPPDGYEVLENHDLHFDTIYKKIIKIDALYSIQKNIISNFLPVNLYKAWLDKSKKLPDDICLTYSSGHLIFRNEPWIVDLEYILHLSGYSFFHFRNYQSLIEKKLKSKNCKKIIPWTYAGAKSISILIKDKEILEKIQPVHLAVHKKNFLKNFKCDKIRFLFVTSINIPKDFDMKGGKEVIQAFIQLYKQYDNLELIIRSYVPQEIKNKYKNEPNITFIETILPWSDLENLFKLSDIFLFPSHHTPGLVILDAMSYELPIITTDLWATPEMVIDGENGFLIEKSKKINYYLYSCIPNWGSRANLKIIRNFTDPNVVAELAEKMKILIENEKLRRSMGKTGREIIEHGEFSIDKRNNALKKIFDDIVIK
jgi:glycosyltransferase involved in cell wall biosynthesis